MKNNNLDLYILINSGKYKGKKIFLPKTENTRATKSIVRGSIFDTLQNEVKNSLFIELFAGSGSIGFEAFSRGAEKVIFFEIGKDALKIINKNKNLFINDNIENLEIIEGDSFVNFKKFIKKDLDKFKHLNKILYIDPPFDIRDGMEKIYINSENLINEFCSDFDIVIIEHISSFFPKENLGVFKLQKSRKFGKTTLTYYFK